LTPRLLAAAAIGPGDRVLDVGCGCGDTTIAAGRAAGPAGTALGLDLSGPMLEVAVRSAGAAGAANVRFVRGDAQVHPLPPAGFDVVISSFGVLFFDDPGAAFAHLRAALRPGGRLAFLAWQPELVNEVFAIAPRAFREHGALPDGDGDDLFTDPGRIAGLLAGAGFAGVRVQAVHEPARLGDDVADVLGYVRGSARVRELFAGAGTAVADRVLATMTAEFAARERPDGVWVEAAAWLVTASR
jgi:SAM-dependent methyltransferase